MIKKSMNFKAKGVTFKNEDNIDIQKGIKKVLREYKNDNYFDKEDMYGGWTNKEIKEMDMNVSEYEGIHFDGEIKVDNFNNDDCIKVYIDTVNNEHFHIGYAPKENVAEIIECMNSEEISSYAVGINITGGKHKYCRTYEEDYKEKQEIETKELTYGFDIELVFHSEDEEYENEEKTNQEIQENCNISTEIDETKQIVIKFKKILNRVKKFLKLK